MKFSPLLSEMSNGAWAILALSLGLICLFYLQHEFRARGRWFISHSEMTGGMRMAVALAVLSIGVFTSRFPVWIWRHFDRAAPLSDVQAICLVVGATIGAIGFLCAMREISRQLYGNAPWLMAMAATLVFCVATVIGYW